jgi:hypothetical protein
LDSLEVGAVKSGAKIHLIIAGTIRKRRSAFLATPAVFLRFASGFLQR